jgi:hypothetical protein
MRGPPILVTRTTGKIPIALATPTLIIEEIHKAGCEMLKGKIDGTETKEELIEYLKHCRCPVLRKKFSGIQ